MNKDSGKTKEQLLAELENLRKESKEQEDKLKASNQQLDAYDQQLQATEQQLRAANQQLAANNQQLIASEKSLRDSEDRLSKTMIAANDGMWDWNLKTNEVYFDPRYYEMAGYRVDEFPHSLEEFQKRVHPDDVDYVMNEAQKHLEGKIDRFIVEYRFKKKNGDWLWIMGRGRIVEKDDQSNPIRFIGTHTDITERKQAEEKLRRQKREKETLADTVPAFIYMKNDDLIYQYANKSFCDMVGVDQGELTGKTDYELFPDELADSYRMDDFSVVQTGKPILNRREKVIGESGNEMWVLTNKTPIYSDDKKITGVVGMTSDITGFVETEEKLRSSEERFRLLTENTLDTIWSTDQNFNMTFVNNAITKFLGYTPEEFLGLNPEVFTSKEGMKTIQEAAEKLISEYKQGNITQQKFELKQIRKDGKIIDVEIRANLLFNDKKEFIGFQGRSIDITERKQAEEAIKESEERFKALHNASFGGIAIHDKGVILECNLGLSEVSGFSRDELIGADGVGLLIAQESRETVMKNIRSGYEKSYEVLGLRKNGEKYPVKLEARQIPYKGKNVRVVEFRDITERKQAEKALRESEEKFRKAFSTSPDSININRLEDGMYISINDGFTKITGYSESDVIGKTSLEINIWVNPGDREKLVDGLRKNGQVQNLEAQFRLKDGKVVYGLMSAIVITLDGVPHIISITRDITKRKQAEEELRESEANLNNFFNSNIDFLWVLDEAGNIITVNNTVKRRLGYKEEELAGESVLMVHSPHHREKAGEIVQGILKGELDSCPIPIMTKDGNKIPVETYINPGKWNGKPALFGVSKDISELKLSEEKFAKAFHTSPSIIWLSDLETGQYIEVNQSFYDILGFEPGEVIGKKSTDLVKMDKEFRDKIIAELKKNGSIYNKEGIIYAKDGRGVDVLLSAEVIQIQDKKYNFTTALDITERKRAEKELTKLSTAVKQSPSVIAITDTDGKLEYVNPKFTEITGYSREEVIEQNPRILKSGEHPVERYKELWETISSGKTWRGELHNKKKNGELLWEMASVSPIFDEQGKIINYIKVAEDITDRKQAEEALLRQERLSAIGELASGVAHDFNNALQIILGGVGMAMVSEDPDELNQYLESIKQSAGDAASRVRQLQRFSQKSQAQKESVPIDINKLAKDVIKETKLFINQYQKKGIHIEIKSDCQARSNIEGVEGELRACLFNLIKNSAEAMPKGGTITISTDEYEDKLYVRVTDTGTGMDKETQKKLFQPFYSTKGFEPGRGLGMAQVYSAIRDHNGDIYIIESEIGKGTVIEFALPISKKESILEKKEKNYAGTANILWVDDEKMIRKIGEKMLKMLGHTGDFAANGKEALELLAKGNTYDLVITDIGMPGMSGWQLAEEIKNQGYDARIAVVTGWGAEVSQEDKKRYNVGYVLGKPVEIKDLKALIGEVLQMKDISGEEGKNE